MLADMQTYKPRFDTIKATKLPDGKMLIVVDGKKTIYLNEYVFKKCFEEVVVEVDTIEELEDTAETLYVPKVVVKEVPKRSIPKPTRAEAEKRIKDLVKFIIDLEPGKHSKRGIMEQFGWKSESRNYARVWTTKEMQALVLLGVVEINRFWITRR